MTDTASTANNDDSATGADEMPDYSSPNDLDFEMTPEAEQALVNETLGISEVKSVEPETPKAPDATGGEPKEEPKAPDSTEEPEATKPEPKEPEVPAPVEKPAEKPTVTEIQTDDLWVEVDKVTTDAEGNQVTEKVKLVYDPKDPGSFLPDDMAFKSDKQLFEILEAKAEMAALYKEREAEHDTKAGELTAQEQTAASEKEQLASWDAEVEDLIESGLLEAPKVKPGDKDWLEDPSVKQIDAVFKFMAEQNTERAKDGKAPIKSFGTAFTKYAKVQADKAAEEAKTKENADAKKKGALVGGSSAASAGGSEKVYVHGSHANIWDVPIE